MDASNNVWDVPEGRPIWKKIPVRLGVTVVLLVLLTITVAGGRLHRSAWRRRSATSSASATTFVTVWGIAKWPVLLLIVSLHDLAALLGVPERQAAGLPVGHARRPAGRGPVARRLGACSRSTSRTSAPTTRPTAACGGVIVFLTWLWITNIIILLGAEFNSEMERSKAIQEGPPAGQGALPAAARRSLRTET